MKKETKKNVLTNWDWTTLVSAWRYYEHRHTITSVMFPHEDDKISGWVGDDIFGECYRKAWRLFYSYLYAYLYGFKTAKVTLDGKIGLVEVFSADGKWYAREGYEKFGENVAPYNDSEIEFSYCVCQIVRNLEMSNERHETVADNVSANHQFCEVAKMIPHEEVAVSKMETTTPTSEKSSAVGNAAAMRKALLEASIALSDATHHHLTEDDAKECLAVVEAALTAPPRNCDVGTSDEQARRYEELCDSHTCGSICSGSGCPLYAYDCSPFAWSQMPYEEGSGK